MNSVLPPSKLSEKERVSHLLRRFGLGAGESELALYEPLGAEGTLHRLLHYEDVNEHFDVNAWQFCYSKDTKDVNLDPRLFTNWWCTRMVLSQRPLEQKLTLFWHNLLVVGANKVEFGPMMYEYIETIRKNASGNFVDLLTSTSKTPAMLHYLDGDTNLKGRPNENFAREVMELFTLGIGNYTEVDVQESAKAFSGWWNRYFVYEDDGRQFNARITHMIDQDMPMAVFCWIPSLHDTGPKTVLGKTAHYTGEELLAELAAHPKTAERITARLWEFFGSSQTTPSIQHKMAASFTKNKGNIKATLKDMACMPEFWAPNVVNQQVKSPVDFVVGILRQFNVRKEILAANNNASHTVPINDKVRHVGDVVSYNLDLQGLLPLHPPTVKGWDWGEAWINTNNMVKRMEFAGVMWETLADVRLGERIGQRILASKPKDDAACVAKLCQIFDAWVPENKMKLLTTRFTSSGGMKSLEKRDPACYSIARTTQLLFGAPEFQTC